MVKESVCRALGYPVPASFKKTQPRFVGQMLDTYARKSNNLQVWNEELSPSRRYEILRVDEADQIARVKVVNGEDLAQLDITGTLTQKYQADTVNLVCALKAPQRVPGAPEAEPPFLRSTLESCEREMLRPSHRAISPARRDNVQFGRSSTGADRSGTATLRAASALSGTGPRGNARPQGIDPTPDKIAAP